MSNTTTPNGNQRPSYFSLDIERTAKQIVRTLGESAKVSDVLAALQERLPGVGYPLEIALHELVRYRGAREAARRAGRERYERQRAEAAVAGPGVALGERAQAETTVDTLGGSGPQRGMTHSLVEVRI